MGRTKRELILACVVCSEQEAVQKCECCVAASVFYLLGYIRVRCHL